MQTKNISNNIERKLNDWIETLPKYIRGVVRENLIVTGGCIVSMLLNEKVNDYDVYFKDTNTAKLVAEHYVDLIGMDKEIVLSGGDKEKLLSEVGEGDNIRRIIRENLKEDQVKIEVGNIALFDGDVADYIKDDEDLENIYSNPYMPLYISPNAITLSDNIQIILRFTGNPEEIHKNYDFVHCTNYYTSDKGLVTNIKALESILGKELKYQGSLYPVTSIIRLRKFIKRGWTITAGEILKIIFQVSKLDLTDHRTLEDQLVGVDVALFGGLIEALKGQEITDEFFSSMIDKAFKKDIGE